MQAGGHRPPYSSQNLPINPLSPDGGEGQGEGELFKLCRVGTAHQFLHLHFELSWTERKSTISPFLAISLGPIY